MRKFTTYFMAISNMDSELKKFSGQNIEAPSWNLAQEWCRVNAGHLFVDGELVAEIPCNDNYEADFSKRVDYDLNKN